MGICYRIVVKRIPVRSGSLVPKRRLDSDL